MRLRNFLSEGFIYEGVSYPPEGAGMTFRHQDVVTLEHPEGHLRTYKQVRRQRYNLPLPEEGVIIVVPALLALTVYPPREDLAVMISGADQPVHIYRLAALED